MAASDYTIVPGIAGTAVTSLVTTDDRAHKMDALSDISFISGTGSTNVIYVDETQTYQEIEGFGASITDSAAYLLNEKATPADRDTVMRDLFSPANGIGLSFIRNPMGGSDISRYLYSYDDLTSGTDLSLASFSIAHDLDDIVPLVQQAKSLNSDLKDHGHSLESACVDEDDELAVWKIREQGFLIDRYGGKLHLLRQLLREIHPSLRRTIAINCHRLHLHPERARRTTPVTTLA